MVSFPFCKINVGLHVLNKRPDGYHNIETCFYPVGWTDVLEIISATEFCFTATGLMVPGPEDENLCVKAYRMLRMDFDLPPVHIHLHKVVPTGAGLGGGSSDAAHTLLLLNEKYGLNIAVEKLSDYATRLGSDCAFFLSRQAMLGREKGNVLTPVSIDLKGLHVVIVKPPVHISTAEAYAGITPQVPAQSLEHIISAFPVGNWKHVLVNDFEIPVFKRYPSIKTLKEELYRAGALYASMSGSGSAVYGLFSEPVNFISRDGDVVWTGALT